MYLKNIAIKRHKYFKCGIFHETNAIESVLLTVQTQYSIQTLIKPNYGLTSIHSPWNLFQLN